MLRAKLNDLHRYIDDLAPKSAAIAFSGGGDSTALLHLLRDHLHVTHAFIIDHNLRPESAAETQQATTFARELGYIAQTQHWEHGGIDSGVQAKAREFRYATMREMCREAGIAHLLTAHTADDQAETVLMRKARLSGWRGLAGMAKVSYAPIWPELTGVYLHRPLLDVSRKELRDYNRKHSLTWTEDPSNENHDFTRIKARSELGVKPGLSGKLLEVQQQNRKRLNDENALFGIWLSRHASLHPQGFVTTVKLPPHQLLQHLLRAVSGTGGPIEVAKLEGLTGQMLQPDFTAATLAGAWIVNTGEGFLFTRDISAVKGRNDLVSPNLEIDLAANRSEIWDGRYLIHAKAQNYTVMPAFGHLETLGKAQASRSIMDLPKEVRPTLPVILKDGEAIGFGAIESDEITVKNLVSERLRRRFAP